MVQLETGPLGGRRAGITSTDDLELGNCTQIAASSFVGLENSGYGGSGGFGPPDLAFASRRNACAMWRYKQAGSPAPVPAVPGKATAIDYTPLIYLVAILIVVRVIL